MRARHIIPLALLALTAVACTTQETGWTSRAVGEVVFDHPRAWTVYAGDDTRIEDALVEVVDQDNNGVAVYRYRNSPDGVQELTETFERELDSVGGRMVASDPGDVHGAPEAVLLHAELEYEEDGQSRPYRLYRLLVELDEVIVEIRAREPAGSGDQTLQRVLDSVRVPS